MAVLYELGAVSGEREIRVAKRCRGLVISTAGAGALTVITV